MRPRDTDEPTRPGASLEEELPPVASPARWFVLLEPAAAPPEWSAAMAPLAARAGGTVDASPHITIAGGTGDVPMEGVAAAFAHLPAPDLLVRVQPSVRQEAGPRLHFGWTFKAAVAKDEALRHWHTLATAALRSGGVESQWDVDAWEPHVSLIRGRAGLPQPPPHVAAGIVDALTQQAGQLQFRAAVMRVTRLAEGTFRTVAVLHRGLTA